MVNATQKQAVDIISRSKKILIAPSTPPDGDSLGSAIALYLALKKLQKEVTVICQDPIPETLQFLPNIRSIGNKIFSSSDFIITIDCKHAKVESIKSSVEGDKVNIIITPKEGNFSGDDVIFNKGKIDYDLIITVDCAELTQLRGFYENNIELFHQVPVINIDHHISNIHFGKINCVDIMAASTTELLLPLLEELAEKEKVDLIDEDISTLLLTGIITDTGSFQNANTTPKSFAKAAELIAYGARQQEIIQHIYKTKQLSQLKLWGRVLSKIQTDDKYRIVWSVVSKQDFKDTESSEEQTGDIIDELMTNAPGAEVIFLMKEKEDSGISVSLRTTNPSIDASKMAEEFGGGGHTQAAGFRLFDMNLRDAEYEVIKKIREFQSERLKLEKEDTSKPMINVEELLKMAEDAGKASALMPKVETNETNTPSEEKSHVEEPHVESKKKQKTPAAKKLNITSPKVEEDTKNIKTIYRFED